MGIRGELFSSRVGCEGRTYFFNVKENRTGDVFLTVVESKPNESEGFERRSIVVFKDDLPEFVKAFQGALDFMGKDGKGLAGPRYAPAAAAGAPAARRAKGTEGFAGAGDGPQPAAPRKRLVVKRKPQAPKE
jgi:hypothetical protein